MSYIPQDPICGAIACPLYNEGRFFGEAAENLRDLPTSQYFGLLGVVKRTWCFGHARLHITGDFRRCRHELDRITQKADTYRAIVPLLQKGLYAIEQDVARPASGWRED